MHKLPLQFEASLLQRDFNSIVRNWENYFNIHAYGKWSQLPLRDMISKFHFLATKNEGSLYRNTKLLAQSPYFQEVLQNLDYEIRRVHLLRWAPYTSVNDQTLMENTFFARNARLYIPIITNSLIKIRVSKKILRMEVGECWLTKKSPEIVNQGNTNGVFLTIDVKMNPTLGTLFDKGEVMEHLNKLKANPTIFP